MSTVEEAICTHICERETGDPAPYRDIIHVAMSHQPSLTSLELESILEGMIEAGQIEKFEDEERGTVYVRDC